MRLRTHETTHVGDAVDLREADTGLCVGDVLEAIRRRDASESERADATCLDCAAPGPLHRFVGRIDGRPIRSRRRLLALAARSRGATAPQDEAIGDLQERLADCSPATLDLRARRRRVAEVGQRESDLRERIATLRGELSARRELDVDTGTVAAKLADATAELAEVETDRIAAEQALADAERRAREARDARDRRLELADALANRRREARAHLAGRMAEAVADAEKIVPGPPDDPTTTRLAVVRVADVAAPVVLAVERFADADHARRVLDAPVVRV
jgi:hypothetical protein